jgi:hypothetical protein
MHLRIGWFAMRLDLTLRLSCFCCLECQFVCLPVIAQQFVLDLPLSYLQPDSGRLGRHCLAAFASVPDTHKSKFNDAGANLAMRKLTYYIDHFTGQAMPSKTQQAIVDNTKIVL